jgi:hypothetical protein
VDTCVKRVSLINPQVFPGKNQSISLLSPLFHAYYKSSARNHLGRVIGVIPSYPRVYSYSCIYLKQGRIGKEKAWRDAGTGLRLPFRNGSTIAINASAGPLPAVEVPGPCPALSPTRERRLAAVAWGESKTILRLPE